MRLNTSIALGAAGAVVLLQSQGVVVARISSLSDPSLVFSAVGSLLSKQELAAGSADGPSPYSSGLAPDVIPDSSPLNYGEILERHVHSHVSRRKKGSVNNGHGHNNHTESHSAMTAKRAAKDFFLRVMPLGASITQGVGSTDNTGYRKLLRQQLRFKGWKVNMVGSKRNGLMADSDNEGHPGRTIAQVHDSFKQSRGLMPNLVLINAGTNDCARRINPAEAGLRLRALIDDIFSSIPNVTVIVSTLSPHKTDPDCAASVSQQYRDLVNSDAYKSSRIGLADLHSAIRVEKHLTSDGVHPNNEGYKVFASVWWEAISRLEDRILPPGDNGVDDAAVELDGGRPQRTCPKVKGVARGPVKSQVGSGRDDGIYVHGRVERGVMEGARIDKVGGESGDEVPGGVFFANLVVLNGGFERGEELDDWVRVRFEGTKATWRVRQNLGGGRFGKEVDFEVGVECGRGNLYAFGDFNNDGLDDFFCIKANSAISVSLNRGHRISETDENARVPTFENIGEVTPAHAGFQAADVRIADIDGDGRADYCLVNNEANVLCSRNGGQSDAFNWQGFATPESLRDLVFDKRPNIDKAGVFLGDINGDFRSDFLHIGDTGAIETFINSRGTKDTTPGIVPDWREAGLTHPGLPVLGDVRDRVKFGRIFGSGRLDYIYLQESARHFDVLVWENRGSGGRQSKSDGNFYCDMRGTGSDDYVWISEDGKEAEVYANIGAPPEWGQDTRIELSVPGPRVGIHLADWTGDGKCDVLVQDKKTGALRLFENQFDAGRNLLSFADRGEVTGGLCAEGWGVSTFDRGMRLADIDGDKRADVLCLEKDGRVSGWLNRVVGMEDIGQVKFSEGWDRANMRFADVEGSGRADLIHLDKYTGEARVLKNDGYKAPGQAGGGSSVAWSDKGVLFSGVDRGSNIHFTNQGGIGRADLVRVLPDNRAFTYFNDCPGGSGGDDGPIVDPALPILSF
ncbi:carbohydrate esterase family 3 protein [Cladorrhinum sp. PSN332]|nr:carbohydrate esterase family 3 protein [Cladorrhinum sp. PSN332]